MDPKVSEEMKGKTSDSKQEATQGKDVATVSIERRRPVNRLITVEPAILLFNVAFFASTPLQIQYIHYRYEQDIKFNATQNTTLNATGQCGDDGVGNEHQKAVQSASATFLTVSTMFAIIPCLFTTLPIGAFTDKAGRKYGLIPALLGEIFRILLSMSVIGFRLHMGVLCLAVFGQGLTGGVGGFFMICYSYMADVTTPKARGFRIFLLEVCQGVGQIVAQMAIGEAISKFGFLYPYFVILALQLINLIYIIFFLPETIYKSPDARILNFDNYKRSFKLYFGSSMKGKRLSLCLALGVMGVCAAASMVNNETITLYLVNRPLCWDSKLVGYYNALALAVKLIGSFIMLKLLVGRIHEATLAMISLASLAVYDVVVGLASITWVMFMAPLAGFSGQIADPMVRSIVSKLVGRDNQGALFASHAWIGLFSAMIGAMIFNSIYASSTSFPGLVFIIAAVFYTVPFCFCIMLYFQDKKFAKQEESCSGRVSSKEGLDNKGLDSISEVELTKF